MRWWMVFCFCWNSVGAAASFQNACRDSMFALTAKHLVEMERYINSQAKISWQELSDKEVYVELYALMARYSQYDLNAFFQQVAKIYSRGDTATESLSQAINRALAFEASYVTKPQEPIDVKTWVQGLMQRDRAEYQDRLEQVLRAEKSFMAMAGEGPSPVARELESMRDEAENFFAAQEKALDLWGTYLLTQDRPAQWFAQEFAANEAQAKEIFYELLNAFFTARMLPELVEELQADRWRDYQAVTRSFPVRNRYQQMAKQLILLLDAERVEEVAESFKEYPSLRMIQSQSIYAVNMDEQVFYRGPDFTEKLSRIYDLRGQKTQESGVPNPRVPYLHSKAYDTGFVTANLVSLKEVEDFFKHLQKNFAFFRSAQRLAKFRASLSRDPAAKQELEDLILEASVYMMEKLDFDIPVDVPVQMVQQATGRELPDNYYSFKWDVWLEIAQYYESYSPYLRQQRALREEIQKLNDLMNFERFAFDPSLAAEH